MKKTTWIWVLGALALSAPGLPGCAAGEIDDGGGDSDSDTDSDTDGDTDSDTDSDSDGDTDADGDCDSPIDAVDDGGFEAGTPSSVWDEASTNFGTPLCDLNCSTNTSFVAHTGSWYAWFGGSEVAPEVSSVSQTVHLGDGPAELTFYLWMSASAGPTADYLHVTVDGSIAFSATQADAASYAEYTLVQVDLSAYGDGSDHVLTLESTTNGSSSGVTNFFVDDLVLTACP